MAHAQGVSGLLASSLALRVALHPNNNKIRFIFSGEAAEPWISAGTILLMEHNPSPALHAPAGREVPVARYGPHWGELGFQGDDPATDLRSAGLLGALQLAALPEQHPGLARALLELSHR
jgi:hypothetical protein